YELLRVILVERTCCVAVSARVPPERTPQPFLGPQGELLVYTPPPTDWRYDALDLEEGSESADDEPAEAKDGGEDAQEEDDAATTAEETDELKGEDAPADEESVAGLAGRQQERLWDGALPLNAVQVGDHVVMALPYHPGAGEGAASTEAGAPAAPDAPTT